MKLMERAKKNSVSWLKNNKTTLLYMGIYIAMGAACYAAAATEVSGADTYMSKMTVVIGGALKLTGGAIGLFGGMQIGLAYMQNNPSGYSDAIKKIVGGGIVYGVGSATDWISVT